MTGLPSVSRDGPHRPVPIRLQPALAAVAPRHRLEVGAGAEMAAGAGEDRRAGVGVGVERPERGGERIGMGAIDGVARPRPVDGDGGDGAVARDIDGHELPPPGLFSRMARVAGRLYYAETAPAELPGPGGRRRWRGPRAHKRASGEDHRDEREPRQFQHVPNAAGRKRSYTYFSLKAAERAGLGELSRLPNSLKVLVENLLRHEDGRSVTGDHIRAAGRWLEKGRSSLEIAYRPARVLMQDFTGVPAVVDLAAMRGAMGRLGGDPRRINPLSPVDLVIDHSVMVDSFGTRRAFRDNVRARVPPQCRALRLPALGCDGVRQFPRRAARHRHLPPGQPRIPGAGGVDPRRHGRTYAYPDTLVGTDSHTTMVNGLAVLGWGVGGIEAEAAMLGQPVSMRLPEVVGFELRGKLHEGVTDTDLVLTVTQMLRAKGVVGKFVEFYGPGLARLSLADRATIANMAPEYGATCGFFPIDREDHRLPQGDRPQALADRAGGAVREGRRECGGRRARPTPSSATSWGSTSAGVEPSLAGPKRPQDRVPLAAAATAFDTALDEDFGRAGGPAPARPRPRRGFRPRRRRCGHRRHHELHPTPRTPAS